MAGAKETKPNWPVQQSWLKHQFPGFLTERSRDSIQTSRYLYFADNSLTGMPKKTNNVCVCSIMCCLLYSSSSSIEHRMSLVLILKNEDSLSSRPPFTPRCPLSCCIVTRFLLSPFSLLCLGQDKSSLDAPV